MHFENVTVYYFSRRQGFTSVPSQGGSTLGMSNRHSWIRQYSLGEFAVEQERIHRDMLRDHLKEEKLNSIKLKANALDFYLSVYKYFIAMIILYMYQEFNEFKLNQVLLACPWRKKCGFLPRKCAQGVIFYC